MRSGQLVEDFPNTSREGSLKDDCSAVPAPGEGGRSQMDRRAISVPCVAKATIFGIVEDCAEELQMVSYFPIIPLHAARH